MKQLLIILSLLVSMTVHAQKSDFDRTTDADNGSIIFTGQCSFADLEQEKTFTWMAEGVSGYKPGAEAVAQLKKKLPAYNLVIFLGTWCEDSQNLIPKLYKTLKEAGYPMNQVRMYGVNRAKESKYYDHKAYRIDRVPTIILQRGNTEVGRIVEQVQNSIESDLLALIAHS